MSIHQIFNDSLQRASGKPEFLESFYALFFAASPLVREKFRGVDMVAQRTMLKASLYMLLPGVEGRAEGRAHLDGIARSHGPDGLGISDELYDLWLECLLKALAECDPEHDAAVEAAWRSILSQGIAYMKAHGKRS